MLEEIFLQLRCFHSKFSQLCISEHGLDVQPFSVEDTNVRYSQMLI